MKTITGISGFFLLCLALISCTGQKKSGIMGDNAVDVYTEEIRFPQQEALLLKSYYLSSPVHKDSIDNLVGYNSKLHSLDYINLKSKQSTQAKLPAEGPDAINRLSGIYAHSLDSIWVSDESGCAFLVDSKGAVKNRINLKEYLNDEEQLMINTIYAVHISHLYYNKNRRSLMFLTQNISSKAFEVKEVFVEDDKEMVVYKLLPSTVIPDMSEGYSFMNCPNVNYVGEKIIYNYPVESSVYTLNILTGERLTIAAESEYTDNVVEKCTSCNDYSAWERHRLQNPYFYEIMYIPKYRMYARLHIGKVELEADKGIELLINNRDLYLMLFNDKMEKVGEVLLPKRRYNLFTGWDASYSGIALFVDNMLDPQNDTDDLIVDLISPE